MQVVDPLDGGSSIVTLKDLVDDRFWIGRRAGHLESLLEAEDRDNQRRKQRRKEFRRPGNFIPVYVEVYHRRRCRGSWRQRWNHKQGRRILPIEYLVSKPDHVVCLRGQVIKATVLIG